MSTLDGSTPAPTKLMIEAITAAQDLVRQLEPVTRHQPEVRERTADLLSKLLTIVETQNDQKSSFDALALMINLTLHPDPAQAQHDHLVLPLIGIGSVKNSRGLKAWQRAWLDQAITAVCAEIQAHQDSETAKETR